MPANDFRTVADELLHVAAAAETHFQNQGFSVVLERREIGFPFTPTLICRRGHETVVVEVASALDKSRIGRWIKFCRSQTSDTSLSVVLRSTSPMDQQTVSFNKKNKIGLMLHDDSEILEIRAPTDLAVHVELPDLGELAANLRPILAPAFHKIQENDWRDGLSHAYNEVEQQARDYLKNSISGGRVSVLVMKRNRQVALLPSDIDMMTLGQLKNAFSSIQGQNHKDALIGTTIAMINNTRIGLAHRRRSANVEATLRREVGQHMYAVINCLEELLS